VIDLIPYILLVGIIVTIVYLRVFRKDRLRRRIDAALAAGLNAWSPCWVDVVREPGTAKLTNDQLGAIDTGLTFTFDKARKLHWCWGLDHEAYVLVILKGEKYKGINCLQLPNGSYVAGMVADLDKRIIVIPEHEPDELEEMARIVGYEAEHILCWWNDPDLYERTKVHAPGEGHPIF